MRFYKLIWAVALILCVIPAVARAFDDGDLVKDQGKAVIYFVEAGQKHPFKSLKIFQGLGYKLNNVKTGDTSSLSLSAAIATSAGRHPRGTDVFYNGVVYFMGAGVRYPYTSAEVFYTWHKDFSGVVAANSADLKVPVGPNAEANGQGNLNFNNPNLNIPNPSTSPSSVLQSNFLKNDPTAQGIASGQSQGYDVSGYKFDYANGTDTNNFAFRFLSALRMVGTLYGYSRGADLAETTLKRFQQTHGLTVSSSIDIKTLQAVDSLLVQAELRDSALAAGFPLYRGFLDEPLNEPTKQHSAAVVAAALKALPSNLVVWSEANFKNYISRQVGGMSKDISTDNYKICDEKMYAEYGDYCTLAKNGKTLTLWGDDFEIADTMIHEYAHYLDNNIYSKDGVTSQGAIDTTGFYNISYNTSDMKTDPSSGWKFYTLNRPGNFKNEFVGSYAVGWSLTNNPQYYTPYEDFAESFALYVVNGKTFRELAAANSVLKQKYDWLKQNAFNGQEYQSGISNGGALLSVSPSGIANKNGATTANTGAFNIRDFTEISPDYIWDYKF